MLTSEEVGSIQHGKFELDCPSMTLRQDKLDGGLVFSGPGYIKQASDRALQFKMYAAGSHPSAVATEGYGVRAGELIPADAYFSLEATDENGRGWKAGKILPLVSWNADSGKVVISGTMHQMLCHMDIRCADHCAASITAFDSMPIPCTDVSHSTKTVGEKVRHARSNLNSAVFDACGLSFLLTQDDGVLAIEVRSVTESLPPHVMGIVGPLGDWRLQP